jgi:glycosyltransferase involved in cell wall biosynthesis
VNDPAPVAPRVAVVQDGARLHYALPLALQRCGMLERVFAAWYTRPGSVEAGLARAVSWVAPALGRRMAQRRHPALDADRVVSNRTLVLRQRLSARRFATAEEHYAHCTRLEARWVRRAGWGRANVLAGFVRSIAPELCAAARAAGLAVVADQMIAPATVQEREGLVQVERWPGWEEPRVLGPVKEFERATWAELDRVTCPSEYVRDGLVAEGVDPARIAVAPYPVAAGEFRYVERPDRRPVTVGFVGQVNLRKGAPYILEVANRLAPAGVRFVLVGPVGLSAAGAAKLAAGVELAGPLPRHEVARRLAEFDLFYFPSTCEGSAGAVMEAMTSGLPVVTSPNSGTPVRDGVEGFVVAYDDVDAAADRIGRLARDFDLRRHMGEAARDRALAFDLGHYAAELAALFTTVCAEKGHR